VSRMGEEGGGYINWPAKRVRVNFPHLVKICARWVQIESVCRLGNLSWREVKAYCAYIQIEVLLSVEGPGG